MDKKLSILLIDDNATDLFLHERFIAHEKIARNVKSFSYAEKALEFLSEKKTDEEFPDVILLDIQMPLMNGFEFLRQYEKLPLTHKCPVVMVSSSLDYGDISRARANPMVLELLEKPLNMKMFIHTLQMNGIL
jgi:CheY-like chemotaxis protein